MTNDRFSIGDAIRYGWETVKGNLGFFIGMTLVAAIMSIIPGFLQNLPGIRSVGILKLLLSLATVAVATYVGLGVVGIGLKVTRDEKSELADLFAGTPYFVNGLIAYIIMGFVITIGFFLLIIPGIYLGSRLQFAFFLIIDQNLSGIDALKRSWAITAGTHVDVFLFTLAIILLNFIGAIPCGLGLFVTMPVSLIAASYLYRRLAKTEARIETLS